MRGRGATAGNEEENDTVVRVMIKGQPKTAELIALAALK